MTNQYVGKFGRSLPPHPSPLPRGGEGDALDRMFTQGGARRTRCALGYYLWPLRGTHGQMVARTFSRNSRLARALAVVSSAVAPTLTPSTMIGPLKPTDFNFVNTALKSTLPVPNCDMTSAFGAAQSFAQKPVTCFAIGSSSASGSLPV